LELSKLKETQSNKHLEEAVCSASLKLMDRIKAHFIRKEDIGFNIDSSVRGGNLCWRLGHGLSRALSSSPLTPRLRLASAQDLMSSLQHHLLALTHRLHRSEVERKDLRRRLGNLNAKLGDFKGVQEIASTLQNQTSQLQQELLGTVKAEQFASVCGELQTTLAREQQTQKLLAHQAKRIQSLSINFDAASKQLEESQIFAKQLTNQINELKKDTKKERAGNKGKEESLGEVRE